MTRGSKRCRAHGCHRQATGAILHTAQPHLRRRYGTMACQEHLEEATRSVLEARLSLQDLVLIAANKSKKAKAA